MIGAVPCIQGRAFCCHKVQMRTFARAVKAALIAGFGAREIASIRPVLPLLRHRLPCPRHILRLAHGFEKKSKRHLISISYMFLRNTIECYLCNTFLKTAGTAPFDGGHLLHGHNRWVMVDAATEGGIPRSSCLEVSLKSLAFCGSVRKREATRRLAGIKGTNQRCDLTPMGRNSP